MEDDKEIIVYRNFDNSIDANIAKTKLDAYGIPCFLTEENMANLYPGRSFFAISIRLHIFSSDRERVDQVLMSVGSAEDNATACPNCLSTSVTRDFPKKVADSLFVNLFGIFFPHKKVNRCLACGNEF